MKGRRPPDSADLKQVLRKAVPPAREFIVYRGSILKTGVRGEVLLRPHLSRVREWAVFHTKDLIRDPIPVPVAQRAQRERNHDVFELCVRKGARARHVQEWLYAAGKQSPPRGIEDHAIAASLAERRDIRAHAERFLEAAGVRSSYGALFHGVVRRGMSPSDITLQPDPADRREWCAIRIADIVDSAAHREFFRAAALVRPSRVGYGCAVATAADRASQRANTSTLFAGSVSAAE